MFMSDIQSTICARVCVLGINVVRRINKSENVMRNGTLKHMRVYALMLAHCKAMVVNTIYITFLKCYTYVCCLFNAPFCIYRFRSVCIKR